MIIKFSNNNFFCTNTLYVDTYCIYLQSNGRDCVKEPVNPGIELDACHLPDGKTDLTCKIIRPIFEKTIRFHKMTRQRGRIKKMSVRVGG